MLPVFALFHLPYEFGPDHFRTASHETAGFGARVDEACAGI